MTWEKFKEFLFGSKPKDIQESVVKEESKDTYIELKVKPVKKSKKVSEKKVATNVKVKPRRRKMGLVTDPEFNQMIQRKYLLIRIKDRLERGVQEDGFDIPSIDKEMEELDSKLNIKSKEIQAEEERKRLEIERKKLEEKQMAPKEEKVEVAKRGRKPRTDSVAEAIAQALALKTVKTPEQAVDKVLLSRPQADRKKVLGMVKTIIREAKQGKGRWAAYTWDEENFLLTLKE